MDILGVETNMDTLLETKDICNKTSSWTKEDILIITKIFEIGVLSGGNTDELTVRDIQRLASGKDFNDSVSLIIILINILGD